MEVDAKQVAINELLQLLEDPQAYFEKLQDIVNCLIHYPTLIANNIQETMRQYDQMRSDTDLRHEFREVKMKTIRMFDLIAEYIELAEEFPSIVDGERKQTILCEIAMRREDGEVVFDFNSIENRALFPHLASFLAEVKIRIKALEDKSDCIRTILMEIMQEAASAGRKGNTRANNIAWLKVAAVVSSMICGVFATGYVGYLAGGSKITVGSCSLGGGMILGAVTYKSWCLDEDEASLRRVASNFDDFHETAYRLAVVVDRARVNTGTFVVKSKLEDSLVRSAPYPPPDLDYLQNSLTQLICRLQSVNLETEKENLKDIRTSLD